MSKPIICKHCGKEGHYQTFCPYKKRSPIGKSQSSSENRKSLKKAVIKPVSDKQKKRLAEYRVARDEYFKEHPVCEYPNCTSKDVTLHHRAGRTGDKLTDKAFFMSLCMKHHREVEDGGEWVYEQGFKLKRNNQ